MSGDSRSLAPNHWEAIAAFLEPEDLEVLAETSPFMASIVASAAPEVSLNAERSLALNGVRGAMSAAGYREGVDATEDVMLQSGFDQGFVRGAHETFRSGVNRGALAALALFSPSLFSPDAAATLGELTLDAKAVEVPGFYRPGGDGYHRLLPEAAPGDAIAAAARVDAAPHTRPGVPVPRIQSVAACASSSSASTGDSSGGNCNALKTDVDSSPVSATASVPVRLPPEALMVVERVETALRLAASAADAAAATHARDELAVERRDGGREHSVPVPVAGLL